VRELAAWLAAAILAVPGVTAAEVVVTDAEGGIRVEARQDGLTDVLEAFAERTGLEVIYEGPPPNVSVTAAIRDVSSARALVRLLEGRGLNYALVTDMSGMNAVKLLLVAEDPSARRREPPPASRRSVPREPRPRPQEAESEEPGDAAFPPAPQDEAPPPPEQPQSVFDPVKPLETGPAVPLTLPPAGPARAQPADALSREEVLRRRLEQLRRDRDGSDDEDS
jgi:hypothetical protein